MSKFIKLALKTTDLEHNQLTFRGRPYMSSITLYCPLLGYIDLVNSLLRLKSPESGWF